MEREIAEVAASLGRVKDQPEDPAVRQAIEFKEAYRAAHGERPSLVAVIALYLKYKPV